MSKIKYYDTKKEALDDRDKGDTIWYDAFERKYYLVKKTKRSFWRRLLKW